MPSIVYVINPNSLPSVTEAIARAVAPYAAPDTCAFECVTLTGAPPGIVTQRDADRAAPLVADFVAARAESAAGFIIACYSDPGLFACRELTAAPTLGIGQSALDAAAVQGTRIGVIAASTRGIERHWRSYRMLGIADKVTGERAIDLGVAESGDHGLALSRLIDTAVLLRDRDGADVIVLGCSGMTDLRGDVAAAIGLPVIDPCAEAAQVMVRRLRTQAVPVRS